jgi:hypothetical protein
MSAWSCCGEYNEHALDCYAEYGGPKLQAKYDLLVVEHKQLQNLVNSLIARIDGHLEDCTSKYKENLAFGLKEYEKLKGE